MKNKIYLLIVCFTLLCMVFSFTACKDVEIYQYEPSDDFTKIAVSFYGDASSARSFSFFTHFGQYENNCVVHLDKADINETSPNFKQDDNIIIPAISEKTQFVYPEELRHYALADTLEIGTKYFYRVGSTINDKWSQWGYFITDDKDDSFTFLHITDSQAETVEQFDLFRQTLQKAFETVGVPEFILSTGDQVEFGPNAEEWDMFFNSVQDMLLQTTFVPVSGNHEILPTPVKYHFYLDLETSKIHYTYEYGNAFFVVIDSNDLSLTSQMEWMAQALEQSDKLWKIVAFHKAPFSSGTHADQSDVMSIREKLVPLMETYGVDLVMNGHDHIYCRTFPLDGEANVVTKNATTEELANGTIKYTYNNPNGTFYVINRTIGIKYYSKSKSFNDHLIQKGDPQTIGKPVFSSVTIDGNKLVYTAYEHDRGGSEEVQIIDCFEIIKE